MTDWRSGLQTLRSQFASNAERSPGIHHLFVEVAETERDKLWGPNWFVAESGMRSSSPVHGPWSALESAGLRGIPPSFREFKEGDLADSPQTICDKSGIPRSVFVPMKLRQGYLCGDAPDAAKFQSLSNAMKQFESLGSAAAQFMSVAEDLRKSPFARDLIDLFRPPIGGVRYMFGEVNDPPSEFVASGWRAGVLLYESGVLIDMPLSSHQTDWGDWVLLLHRLSWKHLEGNPLRGDRWTWSGSTEVELSLATGREEFAQFSQESYYSLLGTKNVPNDVNLASVYAIDLLLNEPEAAVSASVVVPDYSRQTWARAEPPQIRTVEEKDLRSRPVVGLLVATPIEHAAVLARMRPPARTKVIQQVYIGSNTYCVGRLGAMEVVLCRCRTGATDRDASTLVSKDMITHFKLRAIIMPGIAFGRDVHTQRVGNVLISDEVIPYEVERISSDERKERGRRPLASPVLLNRFSNVLGWRFENPQGQLCDYQVGPLLSGEKLVDNAEFKAELFERFPNAVGGDMEGAGLAASAERERCEWIIAKGICDWGDGSKTNLHQAFAAAASTSLVEHVLSQPGVLDAIAR